MNTTSATDHSHRHHATRRGGMTFIEVLASLLVISMGLSAVIGLTMYGLRRAARVQAQGMAMATALTCVQDRTPLGWAPDATSVSGTTTTEEGWLNGFFIRRLRQSNPTDQLAPDLASWSIQVDVYADAGDSMPAASAGGRQLESTP